MADTPPAAPEAPADVGLESRPATPPWPPFVRGMQTALEQKTFEPGATIHFERLQPLPWWQTSLRHLSEDARDSFIVSNCAYYSAAPRKLTQAEIDVISDVGADTYQRYQSWRRPVTVLGAVMFAQAGRDTLRFPFWTPPAKKFSPDAFPTKDRPWVKGARAGTAWIMTRSVAYVPFMYIVSSVLFGVLQQDDFVKTILAHPVTAEIAKQNQQVKQANLPSWAPPASNRTRQGQGSPGQSADASAAPVRRADVPSGGIEQQGSREEAKASSPPQGPKSGWGVDDKELFDDGDDASPVSAAARRAEQPPRQPGGTWEALRQRVKAQEDARQQAKAPGDPWTRGDRSEQDTTWGRLRQDTAPEERDGQQRAVTEKEQYAFNKKDEDKSYAKNQAQEDFDKMLEAERKGGEADNKRW